VLEIPVRSEFPLSPLPEPFAGKIGHSLKHPSGLLGFASRLHGFNGNGNGNGHKKPAENKVPVIPKSFLKDVESVDFREIQTPNWIFLEKTSAEIFGRAARLTENLNTNGVKITNAYSLKTNPDARLLQQAYNNGFLAEAISPLEVSKACEIGFKPEQIILNGPGKWWHKEYLPEEPLHAVFCDSTADLKRVVRALADGSLKTNIAGVRLRTPNIQSRFGIPVDTPDALKTLIEAVAMLPRESKFGVHFHMASSSVGIGQWWHLFESMLRWCGSIEALSGRLIEALDVGGGWFPDDWHEGENEQFSRAVESVREFLPHVKQIVSEPGKALAQPSMALAMRILEIQDSGKEAVVDGSIAELPMYFFYPHRILHRDGRSGKWNALKRGKTKLLGRLCMEHDIVAFGIELPETAKSGDLLVFCDAGAYDRSMSYVFGRG
jgi:diaminopimelate decarboxylase